MKKYLGNSQFIFGLWAMFLFFGSKVGAESKENLRLVISAGSLSNEDPFEAFYRSLVFMGDSSTPIVIERVLNVFETKNLVFFSKEDLKPEDIISAKEILGQSVSEGLLGQSLRGFSLEQKISKEVLNHLGAASHQVARETRLVNGKTVIAFSKKAQAKFDWPKNTEELSLVPAALITDSKSTFQALVSARLVGHLSNKLGVVEELMSKAPKGSGFIELGSNWEGPVVEDDLQALLKRKPMALYLGNREMTSLEQGSLASPNMIFPFKDHSHLKVSDIDLWSVASTEKIWPLFQNLGPVVSLKDSLLAMKGLSEDNPDQHLNIVRVFSEDAARLAARSVDVDLVLLISADPWGQMAQKEILELKNKRSDSYEQVAPIVHLSYLDVAEVKIFGPTLGNIERLEVVRHQVSDDSPKVTDVRVVDRYSNLFGLTNGSWKREDLRRILGGIMTQAGKADVAMYRPLPEISLIKGEMPFSLLNNLINPQGSMTVITLSGSQLKAIAKLLSNKTLDLDLYGTDAKGSKIGKRLVAENEPIKVALSDGALLDLYSIGAMGGLSEIRQIRAPFVEGIYGDVRQLFFAGGPKIVVSADTKTAIDQALAVSANKSRFNDIFLDFFSTDHKEQLKEFVEYPAGRPHHVLTLDIAYLDVGISNNVGNETYKQRRADEANPSPLSRGKIPVGAHLFIYAKTDLTYDMPNLITSFLTDIRYMHTNLEKKPEKDKTKFTLRFRLPWERSYFEKSSVVVSPIFQAEYETQLVPHFWSSPKELKDPRTKKLDSLLGVNFNFLTFGFNMDVGCLMSTDFTRQSVKDAIDVGPALNFTGKWSIFGPLEFSSIIKSYYLFPLPNNTQGNKTALGVEGQAFLRFARFYDFSLSLVSDFLITTLQEAPKDVSLSSIFGMTISYGRLFRLFG